MRIRSLISHLVTNISSRDRVIAIVAIIGFVLSAGYLIAYGIRSITVVVPTHGGSYTEGIVGQVAFVNPILARPGSADMDVTSLLFAPVPALAESIKYSDDFRTWTIRTKEDAVWHDGTPLTSDDIVFTIARIQDPDTLSPLASDWQNVSVTRVSERELTIHLDQPYAAFETVLANLRPIPKHLFDSIASANIRLSKYNLEPIGSGPFVFDASSINDEGFIESFTLQSNRRYAPIGQQPYIDTIYLKFYTQESDLIHAYNIGNVEGIFTTNPTLTDQLKLRYVIHDIPAFKYYSVFFNQSANHVLAYPEVRAALIAAIDTHIIAHDIFNGHAEVMEGPLPPAFHIEEKQPDRDTPEHILTHAGWTQNNETHQWEKITKNSTLTLSLILSIPDSEPLKTLAISLQQQWNNAGIPVALDTKDVATLTQEVINTRNYQMLLFGNILLAHPDLFHFWNSTEKFYPGLNFSLYQNSSVDALINTIKRISVDDSRRTQYLEDIAQRITTDMPALFLVSPNYMYITRPALQGITPQPLSLAYERFAHIDEWYVKTKRVLK